VSAEIINLAARRTAEADTEPVEWWRTMHGQVWEHLARAAQHIEAGELPEAEKHAGWALGMLGRMKEEGITTLEEDVRRHNLFRRKMAAADKARATRARNKQARLEAECAATPAAFDGRGTHA